MSEHPLSAVRLYALLGDAMHDLPAHFIETLERRLERLQNPPASDIPAARLSLVQGSAEPPSQRASDTDCVLRRAGMVAVPLRTLQALDAVLEILHAAHLGKHDGDREGVIGEHLVEGLLLCARALVRASSANAESAR